MAKHLFLCLVFAIAQIVAVSSSDFTAPAFIWHHNSARSVNINRREFVEYNVVSPNELAKNALKNAGWSSVLCGENKPENSPDVAIVFVGNKLHSRDISKKRTANAELVNLLKASLKESDFSISFPYVSLSEESGTLAHSLLSGLTESCDHRNNTIAVVGTCFVDGATVFSSLETVIDNVKAKKESQSSDGTNMIFLCNHRFPLQTYQKQEDEVSTITDTLKELKDFGISYTVLYASDPYQVSPFLRLRGSERQLISNASENASSEPVYCDGVCQSKASLLEGFLVGLVLLIILLSGLCCMSGIQSPSRFEAARDS